MNSDTYKDQMASTFDIVMWALEIAKTSKFTPAELGEYMEAVKSLCDDIVQARADQWEARGY